ncbi:MAG: hypothetical protein AB2L14_27130 [Candidatus Xenobiia bacterium LiM19]
MRSYHMVAITALILVLFLTAQEVCSFTVHRPRKPLKVTPTSSSATTAPTFEPTPLEATPGNNYGPGGRPGGGGAGGGETSAPTAKPVPSPTPSVYVPPRSKFPVFVLGMTLFLLFGVMLWYYTRNVNFKRLFK